MIRLTLVLSLSLLLSCMLMQASWAAAASGSSMHPDTAKPGFVVRIRHLLKECKQGSLTAAATLLDHGLIDAWIHQAPANWSPPTAWLQQPGLYDIHGSQIHAAFSAIQLLRYGDPTDRDRISYSDTLTSMSKRPLTNPALLVLYAELARGHRHEAYLEKIDQRLTGALSQLAQPQPNLSGHRRACHLTLAGRMFADLSTRLPQPRAKSLAALSGGKAFTHAAELYRGQNEPALAAAMEHQARLLYQQAQTAARQAEAEQASASTLPE